MDQPNVVKNYRAYQRGVDAGLLPPQETIAALSKRDRTLRHEDNPDSRMFDVWLRHGPVWQVQENLLHVVANSFNEAATAAVDKANDQLDNYLKNIADGMLAKSYFVEDEEPVYERFTLASISKMEVVRSKAVVFRHNPASFHDEGV